MNSIRVSNSLDPDQVKIVSVLRMITTCNLTAHPVKVMRKTPRLVNWHTRMMFKKNVILEGWTSILWIYKYGLSFNFLSFSAYDADTKKWKYFCLFGVIPVCFLGAYNAYFLMEQEHHGPPFEDDIPGMRRRIKVTSYQVQINQGSNLALSNLLNASRFSKKASLNSGTKLAQNFREKWLLPAGKLGRSESQIGRSYSAKLRHFCQFRSKLAIIHTIAI